MLEERVEFIKKLNIDIKQGYSKAKYKASLPDINAKGVPLKIQYTPSSKVEGFIASSLNKKKEVLRVMNVHEIPTFIEWEEPSIEKPKKVAITPRRQSMRINSNDLALGKPMSPLSKRDLLTVDQRKIYYEIMQGNFSL